MICTNKEGPGVEHQICDEEFVRLYKVLCPSQPFLQDGNTAWIVEISCLGCISAVFEGRRARKYRLYRRKCLSRWYFCRFQDAANVKIPPAREQLPNRPFFTYVGISSLGPKICLFTGTAPRTQMASLPVRISSRVRFPPQSPISATLCPVATYVRFYLTTARSNRIHQKGRQNDVALPSFSFSREVDYFTMHSSIWSIGIITAAAAKGQVKVSIPFFVKSSTSVQTIAVLSAVGMYSNH